MVRSIAKFLLSGIKDKAKPLLAWVPYDWRYGKTYKSQRRFLQQARYYTPEQIKTWQLQQLKSIIQHAYSHTNGYRGLFNEAGVKPGDLQELKDIRHFPFVTKELIRDNLEDFSIQSPLRFYGTTGGSTGIPFGFYRLYENSEVEDAFIHTMWSSVGWKPNECNAVLRGAYIGSEQSVWNYDKYRKELLLSSYYLSWNSLDEYIGIINQFKPRVLQAYPSALNILCDLLLDAKKVGAINFDLIILASENIYDWMMTKYERVFPNSRLFSFYGHAEEVILAPWCEFTTDYHLDPFYGYTEILTENGTEIAENEEGELVGTGFHMHATPFIRYKTMDRVIKGPDHCQACGRHYQILKKIVGRNHEVIVTKNDRLISMTAINMHSNVFDELKQFQFYQDSPGKVEFRVVPKNSYSSASEEKIYTELRKKLGSDMDLVIMTVPEIPKTISGKFRFLDQKLSIKYNDPV